MDVTPAQMEQKYPLDDISETEKKITRMVWQLQLQHGETLMKLRTSDFRQQLVLLIEAENTPRGCSNISAELVVYFFKFDAIMEDYFMDFTRYISKDSVIGQFEYDCLIGKRAIAAPAIMQHFCTEHEIKGIIDALPL